MPRVRIFQFVRKVSGPHATKEETPTGGENFSSIDCEQSLILLLLVTRFLDDLAGAHFLARVYYSGIAKIRDYSQSIHPKMFPPVSGSNIWCRNQVLGFCKSSETFFAFRRRKNF